eukprot:6214472-Pleurochrysis_carterae.AAC.1
MDATDNPSWPSSIGSRFSFMMGFADPGVFTMEYWPVWISTQSNKKSRRLSQRVEASCSPSPEGMVMSRGPAPADRSDERGSALVPTKVCGPQSLQLKMQTPQVHFPRGEPIPGARARKLGHSRRPNFASPWSTHYSWTRRFGCSTRSVSHCHDLQQQHDKVDIDDGNGQVKSENGVSRLCICGIKG